MSFFIRTISPALWKLLFFGFVNKLFLKIILFYKFKLECFLWDKINITLFSGPSNSISWCNAKQTLVVQYNSPNLHILSQGRHIFVVDYLTYMIKIYYNVENVQVSKRVTTVIL